MSKSTMSIANRYLIFMGSIMSIAIVLIFVVVPYFVNVPHPFLYSQFKEEVSRGEIIIEKRDTFFDGKLETVFLKNHVNGTKYKLDHQSPDTIEFHTIYGNYYESLYRQDGTCICFHDDDEEVLKFLSK